MVGVTISVALVALGVAAYARETTGSNPQCAGDVRLADIAVTVRGDLSPERREEFKFGLNERLERRVDLRNPSWGYSQLNVYGYVDSALSSSQRRDVRRALSKMHKVEEIRFGVVPEPSFVPGGECRG